MVPVSRMRLWYGAAVAEVASSGRTRCQVAFNERGVICMTKVICSCAGVCCSDLSKVIYEGLPLIYKLFIAQNGGIRQFASAAVELSWTRIFGSSPWLRRSMVWALYSSEIVLLLRWLARLEVRLLQRGNLKASSHSEEAG